MKLTKIKKVKSVVKGVVLSVPAISLVATLYNYNKLYNYYADNNKFIQTSEDVWKSLPNSEEKYKEMLNGDYDNEILGYYNDALAQVKERGTVSEEFLQSNNFGSQQEFKDTLNCYYQDALNGDVEATESFKSLMGDYQNDVYKQAHELSLSILQDNIPMVEIPPIDIEFMDLFYMDMKNSMLFIACSVITAMEVIHLCRTHLANVHGNDCIKTAGHSINQVEKSK